MELHRWKEAVGEAFQKEKTVRLVVILGICGIALIYFSSFWNSAGKPSSDTDGPALSEDYSQELEENVVRIVRAITGEQSPTVVVTLEDTGQSVYAADERYSVQPSGSEGEGGGEDRETSHILLEDAEGNQHALTVTQTQPEVQGVVVVSQFAGDAAVREQLMTAVCTALHVSSARVCVTSARGIQN